MIAIMMLRRTLLGSLAVSAALSAQTGDAKAAEARKAIDSFFAAVKKNDVEGASKFLSDDLIYTHSSGLVETKAEYLGKLKAGSQTYKSVDFINPKIRVYGDTAVMNTLARMTGDTNGVPFDNTLYIMHVWVRQGGRWQLVAHQTTRKPA